MFFNYYVFYAILDVATVFMSESLNHWLIQIDSF